MAAHSRGRKISKVELYFYEELCASGGVELANEWLSMNKERLSGSSGATSPFAMSNSRPMSRADSFDSSPGAPSMPRSKSEPDTFVFKDKAQGKKDGELFELVSAAQKEDLSYAEMEKRAGSRAGLMYTDAAHLLNDYDNR